MKMIDIKSFEKKHDYLICIDSDGTAIDAMNAKHNLCHGPAFIDAWKLEHHSSEVQHRWNEINLFHDTRGVNRFIAVVEILTEYQNVYTNEPDLDILRAWVNTTNDLSNRGLALEYEKTKCSLLKKTLQWSLDVNKRIANLTHTDKPPFVGVKDFLSSVYGTVDIAVISSSNMAAIYEEWDKHGLLQFVDVMTSQEIGTKSECLMQMVQKGYQPQNVLMIGDAYPDVTAAKDNNTYFYPILTNLESESWSDLKQLYFKDFMDNKFQINQDQLMRAFRDNFRQERNY